MKKAKDIMENCIGNENGVIDQVNWDGGMGGWYDRGAANRGYGVCEVENIIKVVKRVRQWIWGRQKWSTVEPVLSGQFSKSRKLLLLMYCNFDLY